MALSCELPQRILSSVTILARLFAFFVIITQVFSCQEGQISPDPSNCANYIQCNHNEDLVRPCPPGLYFNPSTSTCDWPSNVNCASEGGEDNEVAGSSEQTSTVPPPPPVSTPDQIDCEQCTLPPFVTTSEPSESTTPSPVSTTLKPVTIPPPSPTFPSISPPATSDIRFAPYFDVNMDGPSLTQIYAKSGQKDFTLAFALGSSEGCKPKWGGVSEINDPAIIGPVKQIQAAGGRFIVATGGAMGPYFETLCSNPDELANAYKTVLDAVGTNHVDVDIEASVDVDRMNKALAKVQRERPNTTVSYTLMVQAEDYGLTPSLGVDILRNAKSNGVQVTIVNPMTMEFGGPSADFGDSVIGAAKSTLQQMKQIWPEKSTSELNRMLGVTPMLGRNFNGKIFTQDHARKLVQWANENHIGLLAFWSIGRDNGGCAGGSISPSCSSIAQTEYEFTKIFQGFRG